MPRKSRTAMRGGRPGRGGKSDAAGGPGAEPAVPRPPRPPKGTRATAQARAPRPAFAGTDLAREDVASGKVYILRDRPAFRFARDMGVAQRHFLEGLRRGVLLGARCGRCERTVLPPRTTCDRCSRPMAKYVPLRETGTVQGFAVSHVRWDATLVRRPEIPAFIVLDGTRPPMGLVHKLGEVRPEDVRGGMKVRAVWKEAHERTGSITDIRYFRPADKS